jgi:hypothetical protein
MIYTPFQRLMKANKLKIIKQISFKCKTPLLEKNTSKTLHLEKQKLPKQTLIILIMMEINMNLNSNIISRLTVKTDPPILTPQQIVFTKN